MFIFYGSSAHRDLHSFPTRRSSDLPYSRDRSRGSSPVANHPPMAWYDLWISASLIRSEEHTSELQSLRHLVCRLLLEKKNRRAEHSCVQHDESAHDTNGRCSGYCVR